MTLVSGTAPLRSGSVAVVTPGMWDTFPLADGTAVTNGWRDLSADLANYAPAVIQGGRLGIGTADGNKGQMGISRTMGLTDNVEVTVRQIRSTYGGPPTDGGWQPGPAVFIDPAATNGEKGLSLYWDISLSSDPTYSFVGLWGMFDAVDYLTPAYYVLYDSNYYSVHLRPLDSTVVNQYRLRCVAGKISGYVNNERIIGPIDTPAFAVGRDRWGANNIMATVPITNIGNIDVVRVMPYSTSLGSYPSTPAVAASGATNKATTAASIDLAYPTGIVAGHRLLAFVATINGSFTTPSGWESVATSQVTSDIRAHVFTKTADGTETGNLTVARTSGTAHLGGWISRVTGHNPMSVATSATGQANTASTSLTSPTSQVSGLNRLIVWIGATGGNTAITVPATYTSIANLGTASAAINMAAAYKSFSSSPAAASGTIVGTLGASVTSVGLTLQVLPDPR